MIDRYTWIINVAAAAASAPLHPPLYEGFDVFWSDDVIWSDCMFDPNDVRETH